ncbi:MAG: CotS family spore coat protein [Firmicutes bacterium]|nr:CotS family spore coat protein [Bacillota bacterium]
MTNHVLSNYEMTVFTMKLITTKPDKGGAIWRLETSKGTRSLKLLHRPPARSLFSIGAQDYLARRGARVPLLVPTKNGKLYVEFGNKLWIVNCWIKPLVQASKINLEGAEKLCYGLGEFHKLSRGYQPPNGAEKPSRLTRWPEYYKKIINKIDWFRILTQTYKDAPASSYFLSVVGQFEKQAKEGLARLQQSAYPKLAARGEKYWGLAHQDYGWSNGQLGQGGVWIIDLDGVAFDLPIRDLRKLITSTMDDLGEWKLKWIKGMISAYHQGNPIEPDLYQVLLIDLAFPNEFYKHLKEMLYNPTDFLNANTGRLIKRLVKMEESKHSALEELSNWKGGRS